MTNSRLRPFAFIGLLPILLLFSCVDPTPTPPLPTPTWTASPTATTAPTATCALTPDCAATLAPLSTALANIEATVVVWETVMPDVMQTAEALYYLSLTPCATCALSCPTPTATPVLCQRCRADYDCPSGYICKSCATCIDLCVRAVSPNGDCNNCLLQGVK